jgi:anti-sigma regulatory factor (Ser/Thr protein kinase)
MRLVSVGYGMERVLKVLDLAELFTVEYDAEVRQKPREAAAPADLSKRFEVELETRMDAVSDCMGELRHFLNQPGLSDIDVFDLETVFYEVATNICRHSGLEEHRKMKFVAELGDGEVVFAFTDAGERFDPTGNTPEFDPRRAIRRRQSRGIGLVMIQRLMDVLSYERVDGKFNVVTLRKRFAPRAEVVR